MFVEVNKRYAKANYVTVPIIPVNIYDLSEEQIGKNWRRLTLNSKFRGWLNNMAPSYFIYGSKYCGGNIGFMEKNHELLYKLQYGGVGHLCTDGILPENI